MKILLINQFFWPDVAATGVLATDAVTHIAEQGHDVTVICAKGSYAGADCTKQPPVKIVRVPTLPFGRGRLARPLSYLSFLLLSVWPAIWQPKQDIVITMTTPPLIGVVGYVVKKLRGARHYIWEMDLYPDAAVNFQVLKAESAFTRFIAFVADYVRRRASVIVTGGPCMRARILAHRVAPERVIAAENWADGALLRPVSRTPGLDLTLIYPGNIGLAHDIGTTAAAMRELDSDPSIKTLFVGGGARVDEMKRECAGLQAITFLPYCSRDRLNELLASADIGLVTQSDASLGLVVPTKAYSLMAAGLPILYIGPAESTVAEMIRRYQCGWELRCGDVARLVALLRELRGRRDMVVEAGQRARQAFLDFYDKPVGVQRLYHAFGLTHAG